MINKKTKIYIAGHNGMVGSACLRILNSKGYSNIIYKDSKDLDLRNQFKVNSFIKHEKPEIIIDAAARVGGIYANNNYPYNFLIDNLLIQNNLIKSANENDIKKFIFLGSSCIYPKLSEQPLKEEYLLTGSLEPTNEWYAIAKISGVKLVESIRKQFSKDFVSLMPTNLYGPNDNFDLISSHVLPAMIRKFDDARSNNKKYVELWGTGKPMREFMYVDDLAFAVQFIIENKVNDHLYNVGTGKEISIKNLASLVKEITHFKGEIIWDSSKPDGTPRKLMDVTKLKKIGWNAKYELSEGLKKTYNWFLKNRNNIREVKI